MSGYPISAEIPAEVKIAHEGVDYHLVHVFRAPDTSEWLAYDREISRAISRSQEEGEESDEAALMYLNVRLKFWQEHIKRVEGYEIEKGIDWKKYIPVQHQLQAMTILEQKKRGGIVPPTASPSED